MYLFFKSSYNEVLLDQKDSSCIVVEKIVSNTSNKEISSNRNQRLQFNSQQKILILDDYLLVWIHIIKDKIIYKFYQILIQVYQIKH
ncbi:unnamed protein product [Paramecium sonneborni]|uniref:Uncharacterized protein n=1 Tax=Paramecium sonneborni TaxID=65129 RepID=A0A8S1L1Z5_9CILI|nr:unnamed protein product [Paramecium sonneborni]